MVDPRVDGVLSDLAIEKARLEDQTAEQRRQTEDERRQSADAQAKAAKELALVVRSLADGLAKVSGGRQPRTKSLL